MLKKIWTTGHLSCCKARSFFSPSVTCIFHHPRLDRNYTDQIRPSASTLRFDFWRPPTLWSDLGSFASTSLQHGPSFRELPNRQHRIYLPGSELVCCHEAVMPSEHNSVTLTGFRQRGQYESRPMACVEQFRMKASFTISQATKACGRVQVARGSPDARVQRREDRALVHHWWRCGLGQSSEEHRDERAFHTHPARCKEKNPSKRS